jgi:hypothetical protein
MTVISYPFEIFQRLDSLVAAFCAHVIVHAVLSNDTSPKTRKTLSFVEFNEL